MPTADFDKRIRQARLQVKASKEIREAYLSDLDDDSVIEEIAGLSDLTGMVKKIGTNIKGMAKDIGSLIIPVLKGFMDIIKAPFKAAIIAAAARMLLSKEVLAKADALGIPEAVLATPCPFWIVDFDSNGLREADAITIIKTHGQGLPDSVHKKIRTFSEAADRDSINLLFEKWSPLSEAVEDYLDKKPNDWVVDLASEARAASTFRGAKNHDMKNYSDDDIATLIISSALSDDPDKRETLLKVAYGESEGDESEAQAKWKADIRTSAKGRYNRIQVVNRMLDIQRRAGPTAIHKTFKKDVILSSEFKKLFEQAKTLWDRWPAWASKNQIEIDDPTASYEGLTDYIRKEGGLSPEEDDEDKLGMGPSAIRNTIKKVFVMSEWYASVWNSIGQKNIDEVKNILSTQFVAPLGDQFADVQAVATISDINGSPEFKVLFDDWVSSDPTITEIYKFATDNNNDEIFSRMTAMFRPILVKGFVDSLKELDIFKDPQGKYGQLIKEAEQLGYQKEQDEAYQAYIALRVEFGESLFKTYEDAQKALQPEADRAGEELVQIYEKAKEEAGGGETPGPDAAPDADVATG